MATKKKAPKKTAAAKATKGGTGATSGRTSKARAKKAPEAAPATETPTPPTTTRDTAAPDLDALRTAVVDAERNVREMQAEAATLRGEANTLINDAKAHFRDVLGPYRDACKKAGVPCEFTGGRATDVTERVTFLVEKSGKSVKVAIKGRPDTEETLNPDLIKVSINKAALDYTDRHLGPREVIGNKSGSLANRLRAVLRG